MFEKFGWGKTEIVSEEPVPVDVVKEDTSKLPEDIKDRINSALERKTISDKEKEEARLAAESERLARVNSPIPKSDKIVENFELIGSEKNTRNRLDARMDKYRKNLEKPENLN